LLFLPAPRPVKRSTKAREERILNKEIAEISKKRFVFTEFLSGMKDTAIGRHVRIKYKPLLGPLPCNSWESCFFVKIFVLVLEDEPTNNEKAMTGFF
jgi:hypothetical protein